MNHLNWVNPTYLMYASTSVLTFVLSWLVLSRYPRGYYRWWVWHAGVHALGAITYTAAVWQPVWPWLTVVPNGLTVASGLTLIGSGRLYRRMPPLPARTWALVPLVTGLALILQFAGRPLAEFALIGLLLLSGSHLWFGYVFWPRTDGSSYLGARLVGACSAYWGIHLIVVPFLHVFAPDGWPAWLWVAALVQGGLAVGMIVHLFEQSQEREEVLGRQLSQTNHELLQTIDALTHLRTEAAGSTAVAREQEALVRQVVHDLRNATQAISLISEDIELAVRHDPQGMRAVAALDRQVAFISNFLREKLAWIVDRQASTTEGTRIDAVFDSLAARFAPIVASKSQHLAIDTVTSGALPISAVQLEQLLGNLLHNAHAHCPAGTSIRLWTALADGWATFYVADDGPGIALVEQPSLGRSAARPDGSGVGLQNVQELVSQAGGLFGLVSEQGQGSTFYVTLPLMSWGLQAELREA